ncbi:hypothetical protein L7F22_054721 [Adiantum nelumboides]|nr:hypothetical protein [Adiantum nelumboides]
MTTVHFLCALTAHFGWDAHQSDIVTDFLNGDIFEKVYVMQPSNFVKKGQEDKVCKCNKALYGLKQSPRGWYEKVDTYLVKRGFCNSPTKSPLYVKCEGDVLLIVVLYVDDLLITRPNEGHIVEFKADLNATFKMKDLGLLHHYLDIQFKKCYGGIALSKKSYIETLLCKFGLDTRPDIQFTVSQVNRFMHSSGSKHWQAVKRIFCYLSGTLHLGLFYPKGVSSPSDLHAFSDSDWFGCFDT